MPQQGSTTCSVVEPYLTYTRVSRGVIPADELLLYCVTHPIYFCRDPSHQRLLSLLCCAASCAALCEACSLLDLAYWLSLTKPPAISWTCAFLAVQSPAANAAVENELVQLLDFDKFQLIKALMQNRLKIVWCIRLHRAQTDEEQARIQVRLWSDETACLTYSATRSRPAWAVLLQMLLPGQSVSLAGHALMLAADQLRKNCRSSALST